MFFSDGAEAAMAMIGTLNREAVKIYINSFPRKHYQVACYHI